MTRSLLFKSAVVSMLALSSFAAHAADPPMKIKGNFYLSADDHGRVSVDGKSVVYVKNGEAKSEEVEIVVGQRVLARMVNDSRARRFMVIFVSSDKKTVISFKNTDFRIVEDPTIKDFTLEDFAKWTKTANEDERPDRFDFKHQSEWVWGDLNTSVLAAVIKEDMIRTSPR